jgi:hypothetical protein
MIHSFKYSFGKLTGFNLALILLLATQTATADIFTKAVVKLFQNGVQVGQWNAVDIGYSDGACYVFHVKKGIHTPEVRICGGIFSVESIK